MKVIQQFLDIPGLAQGFIPLAGHIGKPLGPGIQGNHVIILRKVLQLGLPYVGWNQPAGDKDNSLALARFQVMKFHVVARGEVTVLDQTGRA